MKIETKYEIGQHIWVAYKNGGEISVYDDHIGYITYEDNLLYTTKETYIELKEEQIILYEETDKLIEEIKKLMKEIKESEKDNEQRKDI